MFAGMVGCLFTFFILNISLLCKNDGDSNLAELSEAFFFGWNSRNELIGNTSMSYSVGSPVQSCLDLASS